MTICSMLHRLYINEVFENYRFLHVIIWTHSYILMAKVEVLDLILIQDNKYSL